MNKMTFDEILISIVVFGYLSLMTFDVAEKIYQAFAKTAKHKQSELPFLTSLLSGSIIAITPFVFGNILSAFYLFVPVGAIIIASILSIKIEDFHNTKYRCYGFTVNLVEENGWNEEGKMREKPKTKSKLKTKPKTTTKPKAKRKTKTNR
jgi:hypothetical protein